VTITFNTGETYWGLILMTEAAWVLTPTYKLVSVSPLRLIVTVAWVIDVAKASVRHIIDVDVVFFTKHCDPPVKVRVTKPSSKVKGKFFPVIVRNAEPIGFSLVFGETEVIIKGTLIV